ncbi:MAG: iron ABC transporter permease [Candidatus Methanomethylophilaceae archaeon]|nr:iron ABC transporter permease [Candidatus Methanomethylophilaceae archaeon]MBR6871091.1 iron ABC transporter permease [Candidatus Methanomethylophilaceae archaeon]
MIEDDPLIGNVVKRSVLEWAKGGGAEGREEVLERYHRFYKRKWLLLAALVLVVIVLSGYALTIGDYHIGFFDCFEAVWIHLRGEVGTTSQERLVDYVIWELRLPTVVVGIIAGAALSVCGVAMQSILKNPLADPYTTGVSSGAGFGATLAIVAGATIADSEYAIVANAFLFSLIPTAVIMLITKLRGASPTTMIMAGIAVMYVFNAASTLMKLWGDPDSLAAILEWQVGSIGGIKWTSIPLMFVATVAGVVAIQLLSRKLNVLSVGDDGAKALGIDVNRLRLVIMLVVALLAATIVSFTGLIGFVGLIAPHMVRIVIGADNRYLVPISAVLGAVILLAAEIAGKVLLSPAVIPVGVLTSFLGGPVFLWLLLRRNSEVWE